MNSFRYLLMVCFMLITGLAGAQAPARVLLLGTFHFENPGLDVAKFEDANVLSPRRQAELNELIERLKAFRPTKIFVEFPPESQARVDSAVLNYKRGALKPRASEMHQLGYRLAKELNLPTVYGVDYRQSDFPFDSLVKMMTGAQQFALLGAMKRSIDSIQNAFNAALKTHTLRELLLDANSARTRAFQVNGYYQFLEAGPADHHVGAFLTSEWWRRNMIIAANILKRLTPQDDRILVIFGSGHTALLHELFQNHPRVQVVPVETVLQ